MNIAIYEFEFVKAQIEHKESIIVGFFILQYAKLRMLELYFNFFNKLCDVNKLEELEMDTDLLYFALSEKEYEDCMRPELKAEWEQLLSIDYTDSCTADAVRYFFPRMYCDKHEKHEKPVPVFFNE